jgi:predicted lipoprotein with Yx(FWY)xxD motif
MQIHIPHIRGRRLCLFALTLATGALVAGCGGAIPSSQGGPATLKLSSSKDGRFLVDESGHTLYLFDKDQTKESYCNGACASVWPPLEVDGKVAAAAGISGTKLGTITRDNGEHQVTYDGHPLYFYAGDASKPGETYGQEVNQFGADWYLVSQTGKPIEGDQGKSKGAGNGDNSGGGS